MTAITDKLASVVRELLEICKTEDWNGSFRLDDALIDAREAMAAYDKGKDALPWFTVFIRKENDEGTTHISAHQAATKEDAIAEAMEDTREDWDMAEGEYPGLRIFGVAAGDVKILDWDDWS